MATQLGTIALELVADTQKFESSMKSAGSVAGKFKVGLAAVGAAAAATVGALGALGAAALSVTKDVAATGDAAAKASQQVGLSAEAYQELGHAMELSGEDIGVLRKGLLRLARNMNDVTEGVKAPREAFAQLGISVVDNAGKLRDMESILPELADKFASTANGSQKAAIAMEIFGKSGAQMIPFLNAGSEGIAAMRQEARDLGIVISNEAAAASEKFVDTMDRLNKQTDAFKTILGVALLPIITAVGEGVLEVVGDLFKMNTAQDAVARGTEWLTRGLIEALKALDTFAPVLGVIIAGFRAFANAVTIVINTFQIFPQLVAGVAGVIGEFVSGALADFLNDASQLANLVGAEGLGKSLRSASQGFKDFEKQAKSAQDAIFKSISDDVEDIATDFEDLGDTITDLSKGALSSELRSAIEKIGSKLGELGKESKSAGKEMGDSFDEPIKKAKTLLEFLQDLEKQHKKFMETGTLRDAALAAGTSFLDESATVIRPVEQDVSGPVDTRDALARQRAMDSPGGPMAANPLTVLTQAVNPLVGKFTELWTSTNSFQRVMESLSGIFDSIFKPLIEGVAKDLEVILKPILGLFKALAPLIQVMVQLMNPWIAAIKVITKAVRAFAKPINDFVKAVKRAVNGIRVAIANIFRTKKKNRAYLDEEGNIVDPKGNIGRFPGQEREIVAATGSDVGEGRRRRTPGTVGRDRARDRSRELGAISRDAGRGVKALGDAAQEAAQSLTNVPVIFRANLRRAQASGGGGGGFDPTTAPGALQQMFGGVDTPGTVGVLMKDNIIQVVANDTEQFADSLKRQSFVRSGNPVQGLTSTFVFESV